MQNNKKKSGSFGGGFTALLFLLIIVVAIIIIIRGCSSNKADNEIQEPIETVLPNESDLPDPKETDSPKPSPSEEPSPEPSIKPSPTPTPTPTQNPTPVPEIVASGSFMSDTGTKLNLLTDWSAVSAEDGKVLVTIKLYVESYTLHVNSIPGGAVVKIGDQSFTLTSKAVDCDSDSAPVKTEIASAQTTLSQAPDGLLDIPVSATWYFKGTYSEQEFESIEASGVISD